MSEDTSSQDGAMVAVGRALEGGYRLVATLDGALIDDIEQALDALGIWGRPLLGKTLPRAQRDAGPWMVAPDRTETDPFEEIAFTDDPDANSAALAEATSKAVEAGDDASPLWGSGQPTVVDGRGVRLAWSQLLERHSDLAPVIWAFPADIDDITARRHLRNLNVIRLARRPRPRHPSPSGEEEVAFRHADGRIIASLIPLLRPQQVARLLGPAVALMLITPEAVTTVEADGTPAENPEKPLALDATQVDHLEEPRYAQLDKAIIATLKRDRSAQDDAVTQVHIRDLRQYVLTHTGFRADQHICDLVELIWCHGPQMLHRPDVADLLSRPGWSQERRCATLRRKFLPIHTSPEAA